MSYALARDIPYIIFPQHDGTVEVRDIAKREQRVIDPKEWNPI